MMRMIATMAATVTVTAIIGDGGGNGGGDDGEHGIGSRKTRFRNQFPWINDQISRRSY